MLQKYICLAITVLGLSISCKKKSNPPPAPNPSPAMSATISGAAWSATTLKATDTNGLDTISGFRASTSSTVMLLFPSGANSGDTLKIASINSMEYIQSNIAYVGTSGSIVILSYSSNLMTGTFQGTVEDFNTKNKISITGGSFTAKFLH